MSKLGQTAGLNTALSLATFQRNGSNLNTATLYSCHMPDSWYTTNLYADSTHYITITGGVSASTLTVYNAWLVVSCNQVRGLQ
jgi:hypothetical protein